MCVLDYIRKKRCDYVIELRDVSCLLIILRNILNVVL